MSSELDDILVSLLKGEDKEKQSQTSSSFIVNVFRRLYRGGIGALLLILITLASSFIINRYLRNLHTYTTSMEIMLMKEKDGGRNNNITSEIVGKITGWNTTTNKYDEMHILLSRPVIYRMLQSTHELDSAFAGEFRNKIDYKLTYADTLDIVGKLTREIERSVSISFAEEETQRVSTSILNLTLKGHQGNSKKFLNGIVEAYNDYTRAYNNMCYENTIRFLDYCIDSVRQEINKLDNYEVNFSESNFVVDLGQQSNVYLSIDRNNEEEVRDMQLQKQLIQIIRQYMIDMGDDYKVVPANTGINDSQINTIVLQFNELVMRRSNFMTSMGQDAMRVQTITNQIEDQRQAIIISIDKLSQSLDIRLAQANQNLQESNARLLKMPRKQLVMAYIQREREIIAPLYKLLQQKKTETIIARATEQDQARIITPPYVSESALFPKKNIFYLIAAFIGLCLAVTFLYKLELPEQNLSVEDVLAKCMLPVWGVLPHIEKEGSKEQSLKYATALHALFTRIEMNGSHLLLISSCYGEEGKTHFTQHLAQLLASQGKKCDIFNWQETPDLLNIIKERKTQNTYTLIDAGSYHENPDLPLLSREAGNTIFCIRAEHSRMASLDFVNYAVKENLLFNGAVVVTEALVDSKNAVNFGSFDYIVPSGFAAIRSSIRRDKGL